MAAFSIDDSSTTEIDDALSVQGLGTGTVRVGIHIAAPGLAFSPGSALDKIARQRLSTVYMPGHKITMLPDAVVQNYTLEAGRDCPAVSIYWDLDELSLAVQGHESRIEAVPIVSNLRHDQLDSVVTEASLTGQAPADYPHAPELAFAFRWAQHLKAAREAVRGKPETFNRPDFNFRVLDTQGERLAGEPQGDERVDITLRRRGAPLDLIVAEAMIQANSTWGGWLAQCGVPGIYRSQHSLAPGVKVRMGTRPAPHAGMGVAQYTWATSPLRRYVDLVNQWQIIACIRHGLTAPLSAFFKPKDAQLLAILSAFDTAYSAYAAFQSSMERYWTLQYIAQHAAQTQEGAVLKDGLVRADALPLVCRVVGTESLPRGTRVRFTLTESDLLTLDVHGRLEAQLQDSPAPTAPEDSDDDETDGAAPLALALDVNASPDPDTPPPTAP